MKTPFPSPAPTVEIFPGVHATLIGDFDRYSNGSFIMSLTRCKVSSGGITIGEMVTDPAGNWYVEVGKATYQVPMTKLFAAFLEAHNNFAAEVVA